METGCPKRNNFSIMVAFFVTALHAFEGGSGGERGQEELCHFSMPSGSGTRSGSFKLR